ncbi:Oligoendopeptidase F [Granulibacter bethesdensis]|uniref:Oligoendopeptidase F n=2 Tax=Granulibacter bethesdensis TaxID=364410 RepID=A0AAN0RCG4_9PROT|nr:Oligoendopeptidase F [Granulibacter bethesdensis]APH58778.1 Oligoendopeptidase F [Granulibacter bethesdensis]
MNAAACVFLHRIDRNGSLPLMAARFENISAPRPTRESLAAGRDAVLALMEAGAWAQALSTMDQDRRDYARWSALVHLAFSRNTAEVEAKAERSYADSLAPFAQDCEVTLKRRVLAHPDRASILPLLAPPYGEHVLALWEADITTFIPAIADDLEQESKLEADYTELLAAARLEIGGQTVNLSGLAPYAEHADRAIRHEAETVRWQYFADHGERLDGIYDALVRLRHGMARKLGDENFIALAYRRLRRTDYGPEDVARYRDAVAEKVTPLVARLLEARRQEHGWDRLRFWDEALVDPRGNPKPLGGVEVLGEAAQSLFDAMDAHLPGGDAKGIGACYRLMRAGGFMDLDNRSGKAGGGFCTSFPTQSDGMPYIFANFTGTHHDIGVFTHEMGHAFQNYASRTLPGIDLLWPTYEAAEIHSMSLEFLTWPGIGKLVGEDEAERYRRMHLIQSLAFLPYGVCVDHFQHEVYARPDATPAERHAIWRRLEARYMPWTDYGDLAWPAAGGRWQAKQHIYNSPFYYIDYTLALCCALQFWVRMRQDYASALTDYVALCGRGGAAPFTALARSAGLASPFSPGALDAVVDEAAKTLGLI